MNWARGFILIWLNQSQIQGDCGKICHFLISLDNQKSGVTIGRAEEASGGFIA